MKDIIRTRPLNWPAVLFLTGSLLVAVICAPIYIYKNGLDWRFALLIVVMYTISNISITTCYHRLFSHRAFEVKPWVEWVLLISSAMALQGPATQWCTGHRRHHRKVDTELDPYNINQGFWWAHFFWMFFDDLPEVAEPIALDLAANPRVMWQHKYYYPLAVFMSFGVPTLIGWSIGAPLGGFLLGGFLRQILSQHSTFFVNSLCHYLGRRPYNDEITARDSFVMAFLTMGEGYHNYHHAFQADYRNGILWYQWDPTKWLINFLAKMGWASRLRRVQPQEILKARMQLQLKVLASRGVEVDRVAQLKSQVEEAFVRWRQMQIQYSQRKSELKSAMAAQIQQLRDSRQASRALRRAQVEQWRISYRAQREHLRHEMLAAKADFRMAFARWRHQLSLHQVVA